MENEIDHVKHLVKKAAQSLDSNDAMKFAQAALNAAHAIVSVYDIKK